LTPSSAKAGVANRPATSNPALHFNVLLIICFISFMRSLIGFEACHRPRRITLAVLPKRIAADG
jgi:hypothetical protein